MRASAPRIRSASTFGGRRPGLARALRRESTDAESVLWLQLRGRNVAGVKFRRQQAMGPYVLDFYCHERNLVVEVDGGHHFEPEQETYDARRTAWLESQGLRVLRFTNHEVLTETEAVLDQILSALQEAEGTPSPWPSPWGRGDSALGSGG